MDMRPIATPAANYVFSHWEVQNHLVNPNAGDPAVHFALSNVDNVVAHFQSTLVGVNGLEESAHWVKVYPTLVSSKLNVEFNTTLKDPSISLFNNAGTLVGTFDVPAGLNQAQKLSLNLSDLNLSTGMYLLKIDSEIGTRHKRIIFSK